MNHILPSAEYTLQTGLAADLVGSLAFYTSSGPNENISFTEPTTNRFEAITPGWGGGIFANLGEVF